MVNAGCCFIKPKCGLLSGSISGGLAVKVGTSMLWWAGSNHQKGARPTGKRLGETGRPSFKVSRNHADHAETSQSRKQLEDRETRWNKITKITLARSKWNSTEAWVGNNWVTRFNEDKWGTTYRSVCKTGGRRPVENNWATNGKQAGNKWGGGSKRKTSRRQGLGSTSWPVGWP